MIIKQEHDDNSVNDEIFNKKNIRNIKSSLENRFINIHKEELNTKIEENAYFKLENSNMKQDIERLNKENNDIKNCLRTEKNNRNRLLNLYNSLIATNSATVL